MRLKPRPSEFIGTNHTFTDSVDRDPDSDPFSHQSDIEEGLPLVHRSPPSPKMGRSAATLLPPSQPESAAPRKWKMRRKMRMKTRRKMVIGLSIKLICDASWFKDFPLAQPSAANLLGQSTTTTTTTISAGLPSPAIAARGYTVPFPAPRPSRSLHASTTKAAKELWALSPDIARRTLVRLAKGYLKERATSVVSVANTNSRDCWIAGLTPNSSGHCMTRPFFPRSGTRVPNGAKRTPKRAAPFVHRLAIAGWQSSAAVESMLFGQLKASRELECSEGRLQRPLDQE